MNPGLAKFWKSILFANWLTRGKPQSAKEASDLAGWSGVINLAVTGEGGGAWHFVFEPGRTWVREGAHPAPRGTVRMKLDDFFRLLAGEASFATALMLGDVQVEGEGFASNVFWGLLRRVREGAAAGGIAGWFGRRFVTQVLALSGTSYQLRTEAP